ncbi:MAG TPA: MATE family efflux transporter [Lachnospiraceae bacterium]|nr:MATE family efflux transporter [Lachnospiraceae bacterium]
MKNLTQDKPIKAILLFAIPLYIGQLLQLCYSLIDTRIIGSVLGDASLAAVGATISLSDMLIELLNGIICGFGIIISTYFGSKEEKNMRKAIGGTVLLGVTVTVLVSVLCLIFLPQILGILNVSDELLPDATAYIRIIIAGLIATTLYNICAAILRAIGDSFTPLIFLLISNVLNIFLDYLFICTLGRGVGGAAEATVLAQVISAILCFLYMRKKYPEIVIHRNEVKPEKEVYKQLLPTGLSMGFMISFVTLGSLALQTGINTLGTNIIVAHTGARKVTMIFLIPFFVLGTALATFCGQNLGAKEYARIKKGIKDTVCVSVVWCVIVLLVVFTLAPTLIHLVTASTEPEVLTNATLYLRINSVFYLVPAVICILRNSMQGFGDTKTPLVSSFIELAGKVLIAFLCVPYMGYMGVIVSEPIVWVLMVIPLLISVWRNPIFKKEV